MATLDPVLEKIFERAIALEASDIHLEPTAKGMTVRYRVAGRLQPAGIIEPTLQQGIVAKLKLMCGLDSTQPMTPHDGGCTYHGVQVRLSVIPVLGGQSVVMRLFRGASQLQRLEGLGLDPSQIDQLQAALQQPYGLVIIAGPTGSGKTTTFYAALRVVDPMAQKVITVEDPVEQRLAGVCQVGVRGAMSFDVALRSILRQSPNVIGVGELRDTSSAQMALQAALTGHLVVATLHADSAAAVPARMVDMGLDAHVLSEVLTCVVAQRLVGLKDRRAGRVGVFELMSVDGRVRSAIRAHSSTRQLEKVLEEGGYKNMRAAAEELVAQGKIEREQLLGELMEV